MEAGSITTVLGDVPPDALGPTGCHEHLLIRGGLPIVLEPDFRLDSVDKAVAEVAEFRAAAEQWAGAGAGAGGVAGLVDCMPLGVGRDARGLVEIARRTGTHIIATTGFHRDRYYAADHWVREYDVERIAGLLVAEARDGLEVSGYGGPFVERLPARPGAIKVASTTPAPTPTERKLIAAVALAQRTTGLPVLTHTDDDRSAGQQMSILAGYGVPPGAVVFGHMDRHTGVAGLAELCRAGATVCLDWLGRHDRRPDSYVADLVAGLASEGCLDRVVLGQDLARRQYWRAYGGGPGLVNLLSAFPPLLRRAGLDDRQIRRVLVDNPRRILTRPAGPAPRPPGAHPDPGTAAH